MSEAAERTVRRRKKKTWPWVLLALLIIAAAAAFLFWRQMEAAKQFRSDSMETYTVNRGSITATVVSTGNLAFSEPEDIKAPVNVKVDEVIAEAGDSVQAGDVLATLDSLSVEQAIDAAEAQVNLLSKELYDEDATGSDVITAAAAGRIKRINAREGDTVTEVMAQYGALMVLSMDGKMAVDVSPWADAEMGDEVKVKLPSGSNRTGTVAAISTDYVTVTISDDGPLFGDEVTVYVDGDQVGGGELYIHHPADVVGTEGVIDDLNYSENAKVSVGSELFDLRDLPESTAYRQIRSDLDDWQEQLLLLLSLAESNAVTAPFDGMVQAALTTDGAVVLGEELTQTVFTLSPSENMVISVEIDELDVLNVQPGQNVTVLVDAIGSDTFAGTITEISDVGIVAGGAATYLAEVTVPRDERMRAGMTATATIITESRDDIVVIPAEALQEYANEEFVFTVFNTETGELSGQALVKSGLSDGLVTQIVSGLSEGTVIYYEPAGNVNYLEDVMSFWQDYGEQR